jgi:hypothetical protein
LQPDAQPELTASSPKPGVLPGLGERGRGRGPWGLAATLRRWAETAREMVAAAWAFVVAVLTERRRLTMEVVASFLWGEGRRVSG